MGTKNIRGKPTRDQLCFRLKHLGKALITSPLRKLCLKYQGMSIGKGILPKIIVNWPHQVSVGDDHVIEKDVYFKFDGAWRPGPSIKIGNRVFIGKGTEFNIRTGIHIGDDCLIASDCKFVDHDHGIKAGSPMNTQIGKEAKIVVGNNVWFGYSCVVLKGCAIGAGSVIGAGSLVNNNIPSGEIWAGTPARKIGELETS